MAVIAVALIAFGLAFKSNAPRLIVACACAVMMVSVVSPPRGSHDLYSYAMYGRMVSHYNESPYTHQPNEHPADPLIKAVPVGWQHVHSVYGPVFTGLSAGLATVTGTSPTATRVCYQGLAAILVLASCALIRKRSWLVIGLNPATMMTVNGGHNDLLVGVLVALGLYLTLERKHWWAGIALGCAVLVKLSALVALVALALLAWRVIVPSLVTIVLGYSAGGGVAALRAVTDNSSYASRASLLSIPHHLGHAFTVLLAGVIFVGLVWWWIVRRRKTQPIEVVAGANAACLYASPYVLPWYSGWVLPVAAMEESPLAKVAILQSAALALAYSVPPGVHTGVAIGAISLCALPAALLWSLLRITSRA